MTRRVASARFRRGAKAVLALLATLVVLAQVGHWTLVAHRYCVAHGELTHETEHEEDAVQGHEATDEAGVSAGKRAHDHDHCATSVTPASSCDERVELAGSQIARLPSHGLAPKDVRWQRLYLLAPKTSPPGDGFRHHS